MMLHSSAQKFELQGCVLEPITTVGHVVGIIQHNPCLPEPHSFLLATRVAQPAPAGHFVALSHEGPLVQAPFAATAIPCFDAIVAFQ
jgi:hypothetical protein